MHIAHGRHAEAEGLLQSQYTAFVGVDVGVDDAGDESGSGSGDDRYVSVRRILTDVCDGAIFDEYISAFEDFFAGKDSNVLNQEGIHLPIMQELKGKDTNEQEKPEGQSRII